MTVYVDLVVLLDFLVDFFLLLGTNRLAGYPPGWGRCAGAAALGGIYAGMCLLPGFSFLGNLFWRIVVLGIMASLAFGFEKSALRRGILFVLLSMALGGIAYGLGRGGFLSLTGAALALCALCMLGFQNQAAGLQYVPVELNHGGKCIHVTALVDTGNTLRDPLTGERVLVVGAQVGQKLLDLTEQELCTPLETMVRRGTPGLRLIPYQAVGQTGSMLLALRCRDVRIGKKTCSAVVAFAPQVLGKGQGYQALIGGGL